MGGPTTATLAHIEDFATLRDVGPRASSRPRMPLDFVSSHFYLSEANCSDAADLSGATPTASCGRCGARARVSRRHGRRWVHRRFHSCSPSSTLACRADRAPARQARTRTQPTRPRSLSARSHSYPRRRLRSARQRRNRRRPWMSRRGGPSPTFWTRGGSPGHRFMAALGSSTARGWPNRRFAHSSCSAAPGRAAWRACASSTRRRTIRAYPAIRPSLSSPPSTATRSWWWNRSHWSGLWQHRRTWRTPWSRRRRRRLCRWSLPWPSAVSCEFCANGRRDGRAVEAAAKERVPRAALPAERVVVVVIGGGGGGGAHLLHAPTPRDASTDRRRHDGAARRVGGDGEPVISERGAARGTACRLSGVDAERRVDARRPWRCLRGDAHRGGRAARRRALGGFRSWVIAVW